MATPLASPVGNTTAPLPPEHVIFGTSHQMALVRERIQKFAAANVPVLLQGESGTGKDIIARLIHRLSPLRSAPFVKVNCPAIPASLLESELFGYEKGGFTGAAGQKIGRVELAHRGTLFLDEISEVHLSVQSKLLQLLQDGQFCRIGATEDTKVEARVICATNRRLEDEVTRGTFRQDLFYRINVVSIDLPPLRHRADDIAILANYFVETYGSQYGSEVKSLSAKLLDDLRAYHWPGNVRELENLVRRYIIFGTTDVITGGFANRQKNCELGLQDSDIELPSDSQIALKNITKKAVRRLEGRIIYKVLQANKWNRKKSARCLKISYRALLYKMRDAGLSDSGSMPPEGALPHDLV
jgi:two-component system response regulator AtoC